VRLIATALAANLAATTAAIALDGNLPAYHAVSGISGQITVGSDTLNNEMARWAKGFEGLYPGATIEIEGKGSATAPPALLEGAS
jgi:phosphate transport system substrate-binding protein